MKLILKSTIIVFLFLFCISSFAQEKEYDIFLLIGQSNMAGRGTMLSTDSINTIPNVFLLNDRNEIEPAKNPLNKYSSIRKDIKMQQIGPGYSFAQKIVSQTGRKILLVVNARGGSSIDSWLEGATDAYFDEAVKRVNEAKQYGVLKAILWHQGESDSGTPETYEQKFGSMIGSFRKALNNPNLPIVVGEIAQWHQNASKFNPVINQLSEKVSNCYVVSSKDASPLIDESDPHFSRDGQILLGNRYADVVLNICYKNK